MFNDNNWLNAYWYVCDQSPSRYLNNCNKKFKPFINAYAEEQMETKAKKPGSLISNFLYTTTL